MEFSNFQEVEPPKEKGLLTETYENVKDAVHNVAESIEETYQDAKEVATDIAASVKDTYENISDKIQELKDDFEEKVEDVKEFGEKVVDDIKEFTCEVYDDINEFLNPAEEMPNPTKEQFPEAAKLNEGTTEGREFGLDKCSEAAAEIFNPGVISEWGNLTDADRKAIALEYAGKVAEAFELVNYKGTIIEEMPHGVLGSNRGDGVIHISEELINAETTPFTIMDTITHELRHQYQSECIEGHHDVPDEVRNEWAVAQAIYNYDRPSCYDPWGYSYNPLEIDSNYAGNTVVRNVTSGIFNNVVNNA